MTTGSLIFYISLFMQKSNSSAERFAIYMKRFGNLGQIRIEIIQKIIGIFFSIQLFQELLAEPVKQSVSPPTLICN